MTALTNEELLRLANETIDANNVLMQATSGVTLANLVKSRLQAEAPTDAEVAEIEKRHADCEGFYAGHGGYRPDWHKDRTTLLAKLRATSQAEAQAPTTAASVLTDRRIGERRTGVNFCAVSNNPRGDDRRLTVGAPAPAPTREQVIDAIKSARASIFDQPLVRDDTTYIADAILALFARGDTP